MKRREEDGPVFEETRKRLAPGKRNMMCEHADVANKFGRRVAKLIFLDVLAGERVECYMSLVATPGAKYFEAWTAANGRQPARGEIMSVKIFRGKFFEVEIGSTRQNYQGAKLSTSEGYSVVKRILACCAAPISTRPFSYAKVEGEMSLS
jgi:hypothetical protein